MRISDWSSDVCSSDLLGERAKANPGLADIGLLFLSIIVEVEILEALQGRIQFALGCLAIRWGLVGLRICLRLQRFLDLLDFRIGLQFDLVEILRFPLTARLVVLAGERYDFSEHLTFYLAPGRRVLEPVARSDANTSELPSLLTLSYSVFC